MFHRTPYREKTRDTVWTAIGYLKLFDLLQIPGILISTVYIKEVLELRAFPLLNRKHGVVFQQNSSRAHNCFECTCLLPYTLYSVSCMACLLPVNGNRWAHPRLCRLATCSYSSLGTEYDITWHSQPVFHIPQRDIHNLLDSISGRELAFNASRTGCTISIDSRCYFWFIA